ncbi:MAG: glycosyltransferase family 2 protein [Synergistaceae bacterium]|jgi:glycosyltransferase involved in cell wall biosynthesis|nr:glycosyltransferase family 2 protein [Synergistaceae bacterium]
MGEETRIVVAIPCYNEEITIAKVVADFKKELPGAEIIVLDNNSTDNSAVLAREAGAVVTPVTRQGKGAVIRYIFREIDADVYVIVDGDNACPASCVYGLMTPILNNTADMVLGDRLSSGAYEKENKRRFHNFGNKLINALINICFNAKINDIMCGYRAFSRRFAKNIPILSDGFEVETEMTIRCLDRKLPIAEVNIAFQNRPEGSYPKLDTFRDGMKILSIIFTILKDHRPLLFFGVLASVFILLGLLCGIPTIIDFVKLGHTPRVPLAVLATSLILVAMTMLTCAFVLDTMISHERQRNELNLLRFESREKNGGGR